jgi:hypothetical protein
MQCGAGKNDYRMHLHAVWGGSPWLLHALWGWYKWNFACTVGLTQMKSCMHWGVDANETLHALWGCYKWICMQCGVATNEFACSVGLIQMKSCMQCGVDTNEILHALWGWYKWILHALWGWYQSFRMPCWASCMQCGVDTNDPHPLMLVVEPFRCSGRFECIVVSNVSSADRKTKLTLMLTEHWNIPIVIWSCIYQKIR